MYARITSWHATGTSHCMAFMAATVAMRDVCMSLCMSLCVMHLVLIVPRKCPDVPEVLARGRLDHPGEPGFDQVLRCPVRDPDLDAVGAAVGTAGCTQPVAAPAPDLGEQVKQSLARVL